jgi:hypothetical protein
MRQAELLRHHEEDRPLGRGVPAHRYGSDARKTVRYFPDKLPIGVGKSNLDHHVFLYLVTRPIPIDFRMFLLRHAEMFRMLHTWTVRVLVPRRFWKAAALYKAALRDELWTHHRSTGGVLPRTAPGWLQLGQRDTVHQRRVLTISSRGTRNSDWCDSQRWRNVSQR